MTGPDGFVQAYNAQIAVEPTCQLIVGHAVTQEVNDKRQLAPMIETVAAQSGAGPQEVLADNGYCSEANLEYAAAHDIDAYIATDRVTHDAPVPPCRGPLPKGATLTDRMRRKLDIPPSKFFVHLAQVGNTVSSTIPIALKEASNAGLLRANSTVALVGFGVGYSWGAALVCW